MKFFSLALVLGVEADSPWPIAECKADKTEFYREISLNLRNTRLNPHAVGIWNLKLYNLNNKEIC